MGMFVISGILLLFYLWSAHETRQRLDYGYGISTSPRLVQLEIGDKSFAIPQNYIWSRDSWSGGQVGGVNMHALLPGFKPRTEANENEFKKPGWNRIISLMLSEHNIDGSRTSSTSMTRNELYERITRNKEITNEPGPYGLTRQYTNPVLTGDKELYVGHKDDGSFYWVRCYQDHRGPSPSCSASVSYSNQTYVKYTFAKNRLSDWQGIDDGVLSLIEQFENNVKQGKQQ
jgi:hypothetical protein